ncbi:MAG TPA: hypothetical protein VF552_00485 [Allosphingosinicella sp.]
MAELFFADLVREASWGTGSGDLALGGAIAGHRRFADAVPAGAHFHYCIAGVTHSDEWEVGEGELGSGGSLLRSPIVSSAGEGAAVVFSAGLKSVALTVAAAWFAGREEGAGGDGGGGTIEGVAGLQAALDAKAPLGHAHGFASLGERPTTLEGYGITDAQPLDPALGALAAIEAAPFGRSLLALQDAAGLRAAGECDAHYLRRRSLGVGVLARYPLSGRYYPATGCTFGAGSGVAVTSTGVIYAQAFDIRIALTHVSFDVTAAGAVGARVRLGIYDCLESGLPGALLQDLGETAVDVTGIKHAALPQAFALDRPVWIAFSSNDLIWQTRWFDILASESQRAFGASALNGGGAVAGLRGNHVFGPLPAAFPAVAGTYSQGRTFAARGTG